ncbi:MFS transporter [Apilactobacillus sp. TMW 2.2459]|uniref:MFS transporter n=1 Tax=Apilactobacillus xinyiensis TaxID=2841032 RepID=UPI00200CA184|nr:MFS transporter [Apilactobacillus xinyiensis]MCL0312043.1 MFS transporter [Apilactobacillus xinyiensis]
MENKLNKFHTNLFILVLLLGSFTMSISQSSISTAYPTLMSYFKIDASTVQWLTTGFMLIMCVMMPVSPWLLNNVKFKHLFLFILALFDVGTLIVVLAPNFPMMMLGRAMEAVSVGILFPSYQSVMLYITPKEKRGSVMGFAGLVMGSALASGPIISAIVLHFTTWRGLFIFFMLVISILFIVAIFTIKSIMPHKASQLDLFSVLLSLGFIGLLYVINMIGKTNVNLFTTIIILVLSIIAIIWFIYRQLSLPNPLLNLAVLKNFNYDLSVGLTAASYISLIVVTIIFPLYYQEILGVSKSMSGLALAPGAIFLSILNPFTGKLADKWGFKKVMLTGMLMILFGWLLLVILGRNTVQLLPMMLIAAIIEGGNAFVMMPAVTMGANSLDKDLISHGTAFITTFRQILGSTGVLVATLIYTNITNLKVGNGISYYLAQKSGFHVVFIVFFALEFIGLLMAMLLKNTKQK